MIEGDNQAHRKQPANTQTQQARPQQAERGRAENQPAKTGDDQSEQDHQHDPPITAAVGDRWNHQTGKHLHGREKTQ